MYPLLIHPLVSLSCGGGSLNRPESALSLTDLAAAYATCRKLRKPLRLAFRSRAAFAGPPMGHLALGQLTMALL